MPSFRRAKTDSDATCKARSKWFPTIFESPTVAAVNLLGMVTQPHTTMLFLKVYDHKPHWKQVYMDRAIDPAALKRYEQHYAGAATGRPSEDAPQDALPASSRSVAQLHWGKQPLRFWLCWLLCPALTVRADGCGSIQVSQIKCQECMPCNIFGAPCMTGVNASSGMHFGKVPLHYALASVFMAAWCANAFIEEVRCR